VTSADVEDPFNNLAVAACNLLAGSFGIRYCGIVNPQDEELCAASSAFAGLDAATRDKVVADLAALARGGAAADLVAVATDGGVGEELVALLAPDSEALVFAVADPGSALPRGAFREAALGALAIFGQTRDLKAERQRLLGAHKLLAHVQDLAKIGGWELAVGTGHLYWSDEIYMIHGMEPGGEMTMERMLQLYPSPAREKLSLEMERAAAEGGSFEVTTPIRTAAGERRIVRTVGRSRIDPDGRRLYGIAQDITNQMSTERRLWWAANHDPVTSLPNRLLFEDRIGVAVRKARRDQSRFALIIIEIADFARLSDNAGYAVPDKHMMEVAARLAAVTRESDTIARISINEFALILFDVGDPGTLGPAMSRLREQFLAMQKEEAGGHGMAMSAGVAYYPAHARGAEELMRAAEMALARARRRLEEPVVVFDRQIADDAARRRETILSRARDSLSRNEFIPFYQPQIDMETNEVVGVEALVLWQTPHMTLDAKDFTYALDDHEIGSLVGRAVLDAVIADLAKLRQITHRPFRVSVNASRTEVLRNDFLETFLDKARKGNLKPTDFTIEITEDVIIGVDDKGLHDKISYLVSSGVEFSLDDFGTGYASLIHITSFPINEIKIDKQFIFGIESDRRKRAIVRGILQIAQSVGLNVIAEGVETAEQQEALRAIGCRYAQGYYYSFPVPFEEFAAMLQPTD